MNSITHKPAFVQVGFYKNNDNCITNGFQTDYPITLQAQAISLYDAGFNVFPQPIALKGGYPWKRLQYTRLDRADQHNGLLPLVAGFCNLAVMCGRTSGNLFVIDCETTPVFDAQIAALRSRKIPVWAARTARGGHIYLRCKDGEVENIASGIMQDVEIKGRNGYVLAPPSLHPTGVIYEWVVQEGEQPPHVSISAVDWLTTTDGQPVHLTVDTCSTSSLPQGLSVLSPASALSRQTRDYIRSGHTLPEGTRNNRLFKAACDLCGNAYSEQDAIHLLAPVASGSGLPASEILATIKSAFSRDRDPAGQPSDLPRRTTFWQFALIDIMSRNFSGRGKSSERALWLALIERARLGANENGVFRASLRELAQLARMGTATIQRTLKRILSAENSQIQRCGYDRTSGATLWRFDDTLIKRAQQRAQDMQAAPAHWLRYMRMLFTSDASERGALGHTGMYVYQFMLSVERALMPSELAELAGMTVNQVNYALKKMRELSLVERLTDGWRALNIAPDELEQRVNTTGKGERRRQRFERERRVFIGLQLFLSRLISEGEPFIEAVRHVLHLMRQINLEQFKDVLIVTAIMLGGTYIPLDDESLPPDFPCPQRE